VIAAAIQGVETTYYRPPKNCNRDKMPDTQNNFQHDLLIMCGLQATSLAETKNGYSVEINCVFTYKNKKAGGYSPRLNLGVAAPVKDSINERVPVLV